MGMKPHRILAVYFSATGTTQKVVEHIAQALANALALPWEVRDFTLPAARTAPLVFQREDLVVFGTPVIAGRVPNVLLNYLTTLEGHGALAVPVVLFGNRDFDDALIELRDLLEQGGCHTAAAAAFVGEHSFSTTLAAGRPDREDLALAGSFAQQVAAKVSALPGIPTPIPVPGTPAPYRGYYQPRDRQGKPVSILKVKPLTSDKCDRCGLCAQVCPMGSIDPADVRNYTGICIKCGACVKKCPRGAKYYEDAGYLYHQHELEEGYRRRAQPSLFV